VICGSQQNADLCDSFSISYSRGDTVVDIRSVWLHLLTALQKCSHKPLSTMLGIKLQICKCIILKMLKHFPLSQRNIKRQLELSIYKARLLKCVETGFLTSSKLCCVCY